MKTLTIRLPDDTADKLAAHAAENGKSAEEWIARVVAEVCDADWLDKLSPEDRAAVDEGMAQAERGETVAHRQVFADLKLKHQW